MTTNTSTLDYTFKYPSIGWKDKLSGYMLTEGYSDTEYECGDYDELGNPWTYKGKALTWDNLRTLKSYDNVSFTYDKNGNRISKTISTISTDEDGNEIESFLTKRFYFENNQLLMQENDDAENYSNGISTKLFFHYGADGVIGFTLRNGKYSSYFQNYFYKKNAQGDIIGIYDQTGKEVAKYYYDAWGNHDTYYSSNGTNFYKVTASTTSSSALPAKLNPFRYRCYYFDTETNLYYLNSRYYDSETGRFINADDVSILSEGKDFINGLNLYAYCGNNPVMNTDPTGYAWWHWLVGGIIIATLAVTTILTGGASVGTFALVINEVAKTALFSSVISASIGTIFSGLEISKQGKINWNGDSASKGFLSGTITGTISGIFSGSLSDVGINSLLNSQYIGTQIMINSLISGFTTAIKGFVCNDFDKNNVIISTIFGGIGGRFIEAPFLKSFFISIGLQISEEIVTKLYEMLKYIKSNYPYIPSLQFI